MEYQVGLVVKPEEKKRMTTWEMPERHELSAAWGDLPEADFKVFSGRIKESAEARTETVDGVAKMRLYPPASIGPVYMYEGKTLDGHHRLLSCFNEGLEKPIMVKYTGSDPVQFVIDRNGNQRHLSALQKATAVARCINLWAETGRPTKATLVNPHPVSIAFDDGTLPEPEDGAPHPDDEGMGLSETTERAMEDGAEAVFNGVKETGPEEPFTAPAPADPFMAGVNLDEAAEIAGVSRSTMKRGKQAIEAGIDDAVMAGEAGKREVEEATREQRGDPPRPHRVPEGPTKMEVALADKEAAEIRLKELREEHDKVSEQLEFCRDQSSPDATTRERLLDNLRAEVRVARSRTEDVQRQLEDAKAENRGLKKQFAVLAEAGGGE